MGRRAAGLSELTATVILIAITLIAGFAVFSYVNGQASVNENQLGVENAGSVNYLNERFVVAEMTFGCTSPPCVMNSDNNSVSIYIYNNGEATMQLSSMEVFDTTRNLDFLFNSTWVTDLNNPTNCHSQPIFQHTVLESPLVGTSPGSFSDAVGYTSMITLTLPSCASGGFDTGQTYTVTAVGIHGASSTYFQEM